MQSVELPAKRGRVPSLLLRTLAVLAFAVNMGGCGAADAQPNTSNEASATPPAANPDSPFQAQANPGGGEPMLKLENASDIDAHLDCTGPSTQSVVISPGQQKEVKLPAGDYSCKLHGGTATPMTWSDNFAVDTVYMFRLYTKSPDAQ